MTHEASALMHLCKKKLAHYSSTELYAMATGLRNPNITSMYPEDIGELVDAFGAQLTALMIELYLRARGRYGAGE